MHQRLAVRFHVNYDAVDDYIRFVSLSAGKIFRLSIVWQRCSSQSDLFIGCDHLYTHDTKVVGYELTRFEYLPIRSKLMTSDLGIASPNLSANLLPEKFKALFDWVSLVKRMSNRISFGSDIFRNFVVFFEYSVDYASFHEIYL